MLLEVGSSPGSDLLNFTCFMLQIMTINLHCRYLLLHHHHHLTSRPAGGALVLTTISWETLVILPPPGPDKLLSVDIFKVTERMEI